MARYVCEVCGLAYDEDEGLPEFGIEPGTEFCELPEDYECPLCGAKKDQFVEE